MTGSMQELRAATQALWEVDPELQFSGSSAQTTALLFAVSKDCLFLLKSETDQIIRFYQSCFLLYRKSENLLNMLATREREGE